MFGFDNGTATVCQLALNIIPWVLFGALPFGIVCVLAYSTPDLSMNGKMIYAAITYTLLTLLYTVVNIPYCALGGVITNDPTQRISLQSWRFVLATAGGMLSTVLMMPLVNLIGGDNKPLGFQGGIAVLSVVAFMMLAFCFFTTKERVEAPPTTTSMREDLRDIWQNDQWRILILAASQTAKNKLVGRNVWRISRRT